MYVINAEDSRAVTVISRKCISSGSDGNAEVYRFSNLQHLLGKPDFEHPPFLQSSAKLNAFAITQLVSRLVFPPTQDTKELSI